MYASLPKDFCSAQFVLSSVKRKIEYIYFYHCLSCSSGAPPPSPSPLPPSPSGVQLRPAGPVPGGPGLHALLPATAALHLLPLLHAPRPSIPLRPCRGEPACELTVPRPPSPPSNKSPTSSLTLSLTCHRTFSHSHIYLHHTHTVTRLKLSWHWLMVFHFTLSVFIVRALELL